MMCRYGANKADEGINMLTIIVEDTAGKRWLLPKKYMIVEENSMGLLIHIFGMYIPLDKTTYTLEQLQMKIGSGL